MDVLGIAASAAGEVFVYDAGNANVLRFDDDLRLLDRIGREGRGPGEFSYQRINAGDWITADDSSIYVLDTRTLSVFDFGGAFKGYATREIPPPLPERPVRRIAAPSGRVLYAVDVIDGESGTRTLETWRIEPSRPHTLVRVDTMPTVPRSGGRVIRATLLILQGDPLWAVGRRCVYISDGASEWILRVDIHTNRSDTLFLPARPAPEPTESDREWLENARAALGRIGRTPHTEKVEPTARLKWDDLVIDPDGYIWLEPWRPPSMEEESLAAWIVDPATGAVDSILVPTFPDAFLPGGAFVSRTYDRAERVTLLRKFTLTQEVSNDSR